MTTDRGHPSVVQVAVVLRSDEVPAAPAPPQRWVETRAAGTIRERRPTARLGGSRYRRVSVYPNACRSRTPERWQSHNESNRWPNLAVLGERAGPALIRHVVHCRRSALIGRPAAPVSAEWAPGSVNRFGRSVVGYSTARCKFGDSSSALATAPYCPAAWRRRWRCQEAAAMSATSCSRCPSIACVTPLRALLAAS